MPVYFSESEYATVEAACARLIPTDEDPGATEAGVVDYIDGLLGAFRVDPPRIWAGGPFSGRHGGEPGFADFHRLTAIDELAWRTRIEGSLGDPAREFNGPVIGLQELYKTGLESLGPDFVALSPDDQDTRLTEVADASFVELLYEHACEGMYGPPEYGGNRDGVGWAWLDYEGDVQPRGYSDAEVSGP